MCPRDADHGLPPGLRVRAMQRREASERRAGAVQKRQGARGGEVEEALGGTGRRWEAFGRPPTLRNGTAAPSQGRTYMALRDGALQIAGVCVYSIVMAIGRRGSGAGASPAFARAPSARAPALMRARWAMAGRMGVASVLRRAAARQGR